MWDLSLEETVHITLCNSQVMRQLGGRIVSSAPETISRTLVSPVAVTTTYDPALAETVTGLSVGSPVQGLRSGSGPLRIRRAARFERVLGEEPPAAESRQFRYRAQISPIIFAQDLGTFTSGITKTTADGTTFGVRNNTNYEGNNIPVFDPATMLELRGLHKRLDDELRSHASAIRCCRAAARNTTASPARSISINTRPASATRSTA